MTEGPGEKIDQGFPDRPTKHEVDDEVHQETNREYAGDDTEAPEAKPSEE